MDAQEILKSRTQTGQSTGFTQGELEKILRLRECEDVEVGGKLVYRGCEDYKVSPYPGEVDKDCYWEDREDYESDLEELKR